MSIRPFENNHPKIGNRVFIDPTALIIGDVKIGDDSSVWPMTTIRGDVHSIRIGSSTSIQDGCVLHVTHAGPYNSAGHPLNIGDNITVGHKAILHGCTIKDKCLIGMGVTVMDGAIIQSNTIIGANSLVPPGKELESGFLWVGSPVRKIRALNKEELNFFQYSADNYVKLKDRHLAHLS